ncbi:MAG: hypothetical protein K8T91_01315 [Planctomycetes bacterium]|nr:hypothetical protein [Planctomycetota bacterium]
MLRLFSPIAFVALLITASWASAAEQKERAAHSARVDGTFTIPADHAAIDGMSLTLILYDPDPTLADAPADKLDELNLANVSHQPGKATVINFTLGKDKTIRPDHRYYLSARGYRDGKYVYYGNPAHGGIGRVLTEGNPIEVKFTGQRMQP